MRALVCEQLGPFDQLKVQDIAIPEPAKGQVRLKVAGCAMNFADTLVVQGLYQEKPQLPFVPGAEVSGVIDAVGEGVAGKKVGDRVFAFTQSGGYGEYLVTPAAMCIPIPDQVEDMAMMAAFPIAYGTAHTALKHRGRMKDGERVLINGAGSGTGLAAVEVAKALGGTVIALASTEEKRAKALAKGADHVVDASAEDWVAQVKALGGANLAYDVVGGEATRGLVSCLKPEGRLLVIGFASGKIPALPANLLLVKNISLVGSYFGGLSITNPMANALAIKELVAWLVEGRIAPEVSEQLSLEQVPDGLARLASRRVAGRLVVVP